MRLPSATLTIVSLIFAVRADAGTMWTWGARISTPQLVSGSLGILIGQVDALPSPPESPRTRMHIPIGLFLQAEPGVGGGKVALGIVKGLPPVAAGGVKVFYLRTWGRPLWNETGRDYVGVEADATLFLKLSIGVMRTVGRGPRDTAVTGGLGFGF